jgi:hypothetical protein
MTRHEFVQIWRQELCALQLLGAPRCAIDRLSARLEADVDALLDARQGRLIQLHGRIPSKKNAKAIAPHGDTGKYTLWYAREDRQRINDLVQVAALSWRDLKTGRLPAVEHPSVCFEFYLQGTASSEQIHTRYRKDRDNMATTVLDVLVKAGVLVDDDIAHCNGRIQILPAVVGPTEGARIWIG